MDDIFYSSISGYKAPIFETYTGYHKYGKKIMSHTKVIKGISYYIINHPKNVNLETGNASFKLGDLKKYDKNFIFQYYDKNMKLHTILLGRKQLAENKFVIHKWDRDENDMPINHKFFGAIKISDIFKYGREI